MNSDFRYPLTDRKIYVSSTARDAGEQAFGRPADLSSRTTAAESGKVKSK